MGINELDTNTIQEILDRASYFSKNSTSIETLKGVMVANLFFENSTRTKLSFEVAAKKLGAIVIDFNADKSSITKGESLYDTLRTIQAIGPQIAVIRHSDDNLLDDLKNKTNISMINAGAGKKEHPTQALLDALTMIQEFGTLKDKVVTICGDIKYSRVASSNIILLEKMGAKVQIAGPETLLPTDNRAPIVDFDKALTHSDVVMMLRIQTERHAGLDVTQENYLAKYGLDEKRQKKMKKGSIIMHPGPFNREVEIAGSLVEHAQSRIFKQVSNGVHIRMAVLELLNKGSK